MYKKVALEHKLSLIVIVISTLIGMGYGVLLDDGQAIGKLEFNSDKFTGVFFQLFEHNFSVCILIIILSVFLYIGAIIPVISTFFIFGDAFIVIYKQYGILEAIMTYPHFIPEAIYILIALAISFRISRKIMSIAFNREMNCEFSIKNNAAICLIFLVVAAAIEAVRIVI